MKRADWFQWIGSPSDGPGIAFGRPHPRMVRCPFFSFFTSIPLLCPPTTSTLPNKNPPIGSVPAPVLPQRRLVCVRRPRRCFSCLALKEKLSCLRMGSRRKVKLKLMAKAKSKIRPVHAPLPNLLLRPHLPPAAIARFQVVQVSNSLKNSSTDWGKLQEGNFPLSEKKPAENQGPAEVNKKSKATSNIGSSSSDTAAVPPSMSRNRLHGISENPEGNRESVKVVGYDLSHSKTNENEGTEAFDLEISSTSKMSDGKPEKLVLHVHPQSSGKSNKIHIKASHGNGPSKQIEKDHFIIKEAKKHIEQENDDKKQKSYLLGHFSKHPKPKS